MPFIKLNVVIFVLLENCGNNMKIELSPEKYWTKLNWYDTILYLSMLEIDGKNDWILPTEQYARSKSLSILIWNFDDNLIYEEEFLQSKLFYAIPVRKYEY